MDKKKRQNNNLDCQLKKKMPYSNWQIKHKQSKVVEGFVLLKMDQNKSHVRHCILYQFQQGKCVAQVCDLIYSIFGNGIRKDVITNPIIQILA